MPSNSSHNQTHQARKRYRVSGNLAQLQKLLWHALREAAAILDASDVPTRSSKRCMRFPRPVSRTGASSKGRTWKPGLPPLKRRPRSREGDGACA